MKTTSPDLSLIDPFHGVDGNGNCLPGPYLPFGLVRPGPDMLPPQDTHGYRTGKPIVHFSQNHVSGTGGGGRYGNIGVLPFCGKLTACPPPRMPIEEEAKVGYYRCVLDDGVQVEITSSKRTAFYRITWPESCDQANLLVDVSSVITRGRIPGIDQGISIGGQSEIIGDRCISGRGDFKGGWGNFFPYSTSFFLKADTPFTQTQATQNRLTQTDTPWSHGPGHGFVVSFGGSQCVEFAIGLSYATPGRARANLEEETAEFDTVRADAERIWSNELSRIQVDGGSEHERSLFATMLYRLFCMPSDLGVNADFDGWQSGIRHYSDFYAIWDSARAANSLLMLVQPERHLEWMNCLLDVAEHTGWLPDAWIAGHHAHAQGGCLADVVLAESALKGIEGIDYARALDFMQKNQEVTPDNPFPLGRYNQEMNELGYVPAGEVINCVSKQIEYTFQDHCAARLAAHLGDSKRSALMHERADRLWLLWDEGTRTFAPRNRDGSWDEKYDPCTTSLPDTWDDPYFYEGIGHEWTLAALHGLDRIVKEHGGPAGFEQHLDRYFDELVFFRKEFNVHVPYLYHHANAPHRVPGILRKELETHYKQGRSGLTDNEDMGAQSSFFLCASLGLYPHMGTDWYYLNAPLWERSVLQLGEGKQLEIRANGSGVVVAATINGQDWPHSRVPHAMIADGAIIELTLDEEPRGWGSDWAGSFS